MGAIRVVSLFSGVGGLDLGFIQAGFQIIWAVDLYRDAVETYRENLGTHILEADLSSVQSRDIPDCDIVIGGFPCQGFSVANTKRHSDDQRNQIYLEFVRVIKDKQPSYFLAENVKGILSLGKGSVFREIKKHFAEVGYSVLHGLFNAADYGVPQRRERVFLFGVRQDLRLSDVHFPPKPTHAEAKPELDWPLLKPWVTLRDVLQDIPDPEESAGLTNHTASNYKLRFNGYLGHRVVDWDRPSPTITGRGDDRGGVVVLHHPSNTRRLTVREAALIQTFPMDFKFEGSQSSAYRQVANAVPPKLARVMAESIRNTHNSLS